MSVVPKTAPVTRRQPAHPGASNGRITMGFLTANIHIGVARTVWAGVVDAAQKHDVNLVCFPGGGLRAPEGSEAQRNAVYDLAQSDHLDGLVTWSSTLGVAITPAEVLDFHRRYAPRPMVNLAQPMAGMPTLLIDSYQGMRDLITHLVKAHGYRRLAFIRGPESHYYAQERYRAYRDVLQEQGIPIDPALVTPPVHWEAGAEAAQLLLDERGLRPGVDMDAVVAVSDLLAFDALRTLQARGIRVPGDVAIVGFNNSTESQLTTPPLTTVALPFDEQGERAVETLLAHLAGEAVSELTVLRSRLILRESCGCPSQSVALAKAGLPRPRARRDDVLAEIVPAIEATGDVAGRAGHLLAAFFAELDGEAPDVFLPALGGVLHWVVEAGGDVAAWQAAISILRRRVLPGLDDRARSQAEDLCGQARVMIGEAAQRAQAYKQLQAERQSETLREISQSLITTFDVDKLVDVLAERLPRIGIASCYLALYEHPESSLEQSRLVLAYTDQGRVELEPGGRRFLSRELVPDDLWPRGRRYSLVLEPLYFGPEQIGFVLFEIGPRDGAVYEVLRGAISSALKGALLFRAALAAQAAAEKADRIKTRLLANVSHELRTPLNIILGHTADALGVPNPYGVTLPPALLSDLGHVQRSAEHQLRVINDLLDLSRAEIDALDLYLELLDPRPLLEEAFHSLADRAAPTGDVAWRLPLPDRLPLIQADPVRLRQVLLNLLGNAAKFTEKGQIVLGAEVSPPHLHVWVEDTGIGIPPDQQERIFEPFVTAEHDARLDGRRWSGIGLGLSITRRLVALHGGSMALDSRPGQGSTFHVYLPLPSLGEPAPPFQEPTHPVLLWISASDQPAAEIVEFSERRGIEVRRLHAGDDLDAVLAGVPSAVLAWDLAGASPGDWAIVRRLRNHPRLRQAPFILYGQEQTGAAALTVGLTGFVVKPASGQTLLDLINAAAPVASAGPILIVDDDPQAREQYRGIVTAGLPGYPIQTADDGAAALALLAQQTPSLVILDLMMPGLDGFDLLDRLRADPRTRQVPVVILSGRLLNREDVKRLEQHALVTFQSKGVLSEAEIIASWHRALFGADVLPPQTSALVKRAVAYLHQNYARPLARWEVADAIGVSADYLGRVFGRELGLSPWDYLNRLRVEQAKRLLRQTGDSIGAIARQVGFKDQLYFSRVFRKLTGLSPTAFRDSREASL